MFIRTEETPNPLSLKFIPDGRAVMTSGTAEFRNQKQAATKSPLALQLFEIKGVDGIFFGSDFITITKKEDFDWENLKPEVFASIMDFFVTDKPIIFDQPDSAESKEGAKDEDSEIVKQIKELIEVKVRPAVAMDGGDIIFHSFESGIVKLVLRGSCSGCPSSTITLKNGIENMLKHYIPEVESVEQIFDY